MTVLLVLLAVLLLPAPGSAAAVEPASGEAWRPAALFGADVRSLAVHPRKPDLLVAGTSGGQVYLSRDGGESWSDAGVPVPFPGWVVSELLFDPDHPDRIWAALRGMWGSGAVTWTDDLGISWYPASGEDRATLPAEPIYALARVPGRPGHLYAGALSGVWGSRDGGESWRHLSAAHPEIYSASSLLVDRARPDTVLVGTWRRAYRSDDSGATWRPIHEGMKLDSEVFSLNPVPGRPGELWASTCGWVYHSADLGERWRRHKEGLPERRTPSFAVLPGGRLLAGTVAGVWRSDDGGATWRRTRSPEVSARVLVHHAERPERVILGTEGAGVWVSKDGGESFHRAVRSMTNVRVGAMEVLGKGREIVVAVNHAGPLSGLYSSRDGGATFSRDPQELPTVLALARDADGRLYAATERGLWERYAAWRKVAEVGERRVDDVVAHGDRVVALTAEGLFERRGPRFEEVGYGGDGARPHSAVLDGRRLWVADGLSIHRLAGEERESVPAPFAGGRLDRLGDGLLVWGSGGVRFQAEPDAPWVELTDEPSEVVPTGEGRFPFLLVRGRELGLYDRRRGALVRLPVHFPPRDVTAAAVVGSQLLLGTSGYGVLVRELPAADTDGGVEAAAATSTPGEAAATGTAGGT